MTLFVNGVVHLCELQQTLNSHSNCNQLRNNGLLLTEDDKTN